MDIRGHAAAIQNIASNWRLQCCGAFSLGATLNLSSSVPLDLARPAWVVRLSGEILRAIFHEDQLIDPSVVVEAHLSSRLLNQFW